MRSRSKQQEREQAQVQACHDIITYKHEGQASHNRCEARAKPNQRLVEVFGIKNIFTDEDISSHGEFRTGAIRKMKTACKMSTKDDKGDWTDLRAYAVQYCKEYLEREGSRSIKLAELVQFITLKLSLSYLFSSAELASTIRDTFEDVKFIGHQINNLWIESKRPDGERPQWADQHDLHRSLRRVTDATSTVMPGAFPQEFAGGTEPTIPE